MPDRVFLDTNVFVYLYDSDSPDKQARARALDGLILQAALRSGCTLLLSEDLQHGQRIGNLRIENPFL